MRMLLRRILREFSRVICIRLRSERPFTGVSGPSGAKIAKKSQKESFFGVCKEVPENTRKSQKIHKIGLFGVFLTFSDIFGDFFADPQKRLFLRLFCDFGPGKPGDSCKWSPDPLRHPLRCPLRRGP